MGEAVGTEGGGQAAPLVIVLGPSALRTAARICEVCPGAEIAARRARFSSLDELQAMLDGPEPTGAGRCTARLFDDLADCLTQTFRAGRPIVGVCSSAILIRTLALHLSDKTQEPPVLAVAEDGSSVVPLLGGHRGANALARKLAAALDGTAAITTAGDVRFGIALDAPPQGWSLPSAAPVKEVTAALLAGGEVHISDDLTWLDEPLADDAGPATTPRARMTAHTQAHAASGSSQPKLSIKASVHRTAHPMDDNELTLIYHPRAVVVGVGSDRNCPPADLAELVEAALASSSIAPEAVACVASIDLKADERAVIELAERLGVPARFFSADEINAVAARIPNPSDIVLREVGVPGVAEGAALCAVGTQGRLLVEKRKAARCTVAIAAAPAPIDPHRIGRPRGHLSVVGLGPGAVAWRTPQATAALHEAEDWVGYDLYLDLARDLASNQQEHRFPLGGEEDRVRHALRLASAGRRVALVCSGDPGIYAMAALVFEVLALHGVDDSVTRAMAQVDVEVCPGISAFQAAAARLGAPIGHDFCCISLSDLLTPWQAIEQRLNAAAQGDFVVAFYNPRSQRRRHQLPAAMAILAAHRPADTPVAIATDLGRPAEAVTMTTIGAFNCDDVDMLSLVMVGSGQSRIADVRGTKFMFTPRGYAAKRGEA